MFKLQGNLFISAHLETANNNISWTHTKMCGHLVSHHFHSASTLRIDTADNLQGAHQSVIFSFTLVESRMTSCLTIHHGTLRFSNVREY